MSELKLMIEKLNHIIESQSDAQRKLLSKSIATQLLKSQASRITTNKNPDGSAFEPRKKQTLRTRKGAMRKTMFNRMVRAKWLKAKNSATDASIEFIGNAAKIARVSQLGLRDKVNKRGLEVTYPKRELLGFTDSEINMIEDLIIDSLSV